MTSRVLAAAALIVASTALACHGYPRDSHGTLERVRSGTMRVGVIERPPWTFGDGATPRGVEIELVRRFADEIGAKDIAWIRGAEEALLSSLERHDLDLVVGGLVADDPWKARIGASRAYYTERMCVGTVEDEPHFEPKGRRITTRDGEPLAAVLETKGADVARVPVLHRDDAPVGAPEWQIHAWGLHVATCPRRREHIVAVGPGENAFALRLDRTLAAQSREVPALLVREGASPS